MAILNQKRILNLIPKTSAPVTIHVSQGDVGTEIEFTLVKGDELFVNTGNLSASVHGVREDGANFGVFTCILSGSSVKFPLHAEMTAVKGSAIGEIVLVDSQGNKVGSSNFGIMVEESVFPLGVTYDNDVSVYESILAYVQTIPAQVEADFNTAIAQEASTRSSQIQTLTNNLNAEISARQSGDSSEASTRASAVSNLQSQIDQIIAPSGEAPSAAEVENARVGADGITYPTLGTAIRTQLTGVVSAIDESLSELHGSVVYDPYNIFVNSDMESGSITSVGVDESNSNFYRNSTHQRIPSEASHLICNYNYFVAFYDIEKNFIIRANANGNNAVTIPSGAYYFRMIFTKAVYEAYSSNIIIIGDNYSPSLNLPFAEHYTIKDNVSVPQINPPSNLYIFNDFESGTITGAGVDEDNSYFERNATYHKLESFKSLTANSDMYIAYYDIGKHFIQRDTLTANTPSNIPLGAYYYRLLIVATTNTAHKNSISVRYGNHTEIEHNCNVPGKGFYYYRFGGNGIDWCFVHTPSDYDPKRPQPYPFIICNHGNGWVMDGTPKKANWTDYSMYVPVGEAQAGKYQNETSDSSLWYSNPTIEELLSNGFVVCGCENFADSIYGNENCRKACVDFFEHMLKNYNTTPYCGMIGASNGAQTSINAAFYLQDRVRAMILQYPLTCLVNQYFYNEGQQAGIRNAYGITNPTPTESELIEATATHDVLHTNIADGKRVDMFPPTKLYYSLGDDVTPATENAIPLRNLLLDSTKIVEEAVVSGGHGSSSHFDPTGFADFFNKFM